MWKALPLFLTIPCAVLLSLLAFCPVSEAEGNAPSGRKLKPVAAPSPFVSLDGKRGINFQFRSLKPPRSIVLNFTEFGVGGVSPVSGQDASPVTVITKLKGKLPRYQVQVTSLLLSGSLSYDVHVSLKEKGQKKAIKTKVVHLQGSPETLNQQIDLPATDLTDSVVTLTQDPDRQCVLIGDSGDLTIKDLPSCKVRLSRRNFCQRELVFVYQSVHTQSGIPDTPRRVLVRWPLAPTGASLKPGVPAQGAYVGIHPNFDLFSMNDVHRRFGVHFPIAGIFLDPRYWGDFTFFTPRFQSIRAEGSAAIVTLNYRESYPDIDYDQVRNLGCYLRNQEMPVFLRVLHEMNGSWFKWGQKPVEYRAVYRKIALIMRQEVPDISLVWAPNHPAGYPFGGQRSPTDSDFAELDTNHDGVWDVRDDPFTPYYPGDDVVDWVGMSAFHIGANGIYFKNIAPDQHEWSVMNGKFGTYYSMHAFSVLHKKPMMIAETGTFYFASPPEENYNSEEEVKIGWMEQVLNFNNPNFYSLNKDLPNIKAILWFNIDKYETESPYLCLWSLDNNPNVRGYFQSSMANPYFVQTLQR